MVASDSPLPRLAKVTIAKSKTFGPTARLRKSSDIARLRSAGSKLYSKHFLLVVAPAPDVESRLAIAVTTKIEKRATVRNLIKRRLRSIFRENRHHLVDPIDVLIVARREVQSCHYSDYRREILGTLRTHGYLASTSEEREDTPLKVIRHTETASKMGSNSGIKGGE